MNTLITDALGCWLMFAGGFFYYQLIITPPDPSDQRPLPPWVWAIVISFALFPFVGLLVVLANHNLL